MNFLKKYSSLNRNGNKNLGKLSIGITSAYKGAGATHLGLMLTACMSEGLGLKTAYLHCQNSKDIAYLYNYFHSLNERGRGGAFTVANATFYPYVSSEMIAHILARGYDSVVLDFGKDYSEYKEEFLRCDKKITVGSLLPWKRYYLEEFIRKSENVTGSAEWIYAVTHTDSKTVAKEAKQLQKKLFVIPYLEDPFYLSSEAMNITKSIINYERADKG